MKEKTKMISLKIHEDLHDQCMKIFHEKKLSGDKAGWHEVLIPALKSYVKKNSRRANE